MPFALFPLMLCVFSVGSAELVVAGVLPAIAGDLDVSLSDAGLLVTAYALGVVVLGPLVTLASSRVPRTPLLLGLMGLFTASNVLAALAPTYAVLMTARVLSAITHCTLFAVCIVVAGSLAEKGKEASAVSRVAVGLNLATVLGVPLGVLLEEHFGWRSAFWSIAGLSLIALALVAWRPPAAPVPVAGESGGVAAELRVLRNRTVQIAILLTALAMAGVFTAYTFVNPILTSMGGFDDSTVSWLLLLVGCGSLIGNLIGGKLADRALMPSLVGVLAVLGADLALMALGGEVPWLLLVLLVVFGAAYFAVMPGLQARILKGAGDGAPTLAIAINIGAFNIGIAFGAWFGGQLLGWDLGLRVVIAASALLSWLAMSLAANELRKDRRAERTAAVPSPVDPAPVPRVPATADASTD
ncbi:MULTISPECIES: MFS transporter [Streptomyces]|uniref:MFS transporter n=1 Tax=Streptomyces venezuelae TaxID=54571 RepID=A0A5P2BED4_STRVZ|nr:MULTISPECIES: MFS transporter [Streptomyces]NEA05996.1 MFS transporter [Streptomyces sp. SID10116]MYZ16624.1 MFS transporter [Streptomyces sp. SID337]NDZ88524.1 MFS transporter [Streptomyces sp. SID10115]NEB44197.1 MFS transporter [Streptomyces sp. SID339]QES28716.1 MFS transporter [Streptomyces venezuelae]